MYLLILETNALLATLDIIDLHTSVTVVLVHVWLAQITITAHRANLVIF